MTWNIRKHRRGNECTEHLYPRLVSWESSHRRQWDTICSPHPCGSVQYVLFQIQGRWIMHLLFFLLQKSFPCDSILSDLPTLEHQWGISGYREKAHWEREISSVLLLKYWSRSLDWFNSHDFLDTTGACLPVISPLDNLLGGGPAEWAIKQFYVTLSGVDSMMCCSKSGKKNPVILMDFNFHWEGCCLSAVFSFGLHLRVSLAVTPKYR